MSTGYSMTELMNILLGQIPPVQGSPNCIHKLYKLMASIRSSSTNVCPSYQSEGRSDSKPQPRFMSDPSLRRPTPLMLGRHNEPSPGPWQRPCAPDFTTGEPSLLHALGPDGLPPVAFYMDDIFSGRKSFKQALYFLEHHLLPRIAWSMLKLSFKKLVLFTDRIEALGVVKVRHSRSEKIQSWPVPRTSTEVRAFLGAISITWRRVKNFSEIARPLTRLTREVDWVWADLEQLSFETLRTRCLDTVDMRGILEGVALRMYSDASKYAGRLCHYADAQNHNVF